jgi:hypothetical protein
MSMDRLRGTCLVGLLVSQKRHLGHQFYAKDMALATVGRWTQVIAKKSMLWVHFLRSIIKHKWLGLIEVEIL